MRRLGVLVLLLLTSGCASPTPSEDPAASPTPDPGTLTLLDKYAYHGTGCVELGLHVPVPARNVRPHVPAHYRLVGEGQGQAVLAFAFARCDRMVSPGAQGPALVVQVDVAVMVEGGAYELAFPVNHYGIAANASRAGFPARYAPTATMLGYSLRGTDLVQVHVRSGNLTIDAEATAARAPVTGTAGGTYYHDGPNGTSRMVYDVRLSTVGPATGRVTAPSGSYLAGLMGGSVAEGQGFYGSFSLGANLTRTSR